jgi:hypothetical protein
MSYKDQPWGARYAKLGDQAEKAFEEFADERGIKYIRWGLDRPNLDVKQLPERIRYTPDYLCENFYVECIGFSSSKAGATAKLAVAKWNSLQWHATTHQVFLWVYDSYKKRGKLIHLADVNAMIDAGTVQLGSFPEKKAYWGLPAKELFAA